MPYTLRIVFSGLCAFVPERSFDSREPPKEVTVLLRNLFTPIVFSTGAVMAPHIPRVELEPKHHRKSSTRKADFTAHPETPEARSFYVLRFEDLLFRPGGKASAGPLEVVADRPSPQGEQAPTAAEARSLFFLPTVQEAAGNQAVVKQELLGRLLPDERNPPLAGRAFITAGTLSTHKLQEGLWRIGPQGNAKKLANSIALQFDKVEGDSEILFREFDQAEPAKLVFGPATDDPKEEVEVHVKNAEIDTLLEHLGEKVVVEDRDFEAYFDLCELGASRLRHIPEEANLTVIGPGGCSPAAIPKTGATTG